MNYLMTKQAKVVAMTCTHAALRRGEFLRLGFQYDNLLMEESAQILEIETFIPMLLQVLDACHAQVVVCHMCWVPSGLLQGGLSVLPATGGGRLHHVQAQVAPTPAWLHRKRRPPRCVQAQLHQPPWGQQGSDICPAV